MNQTNDQHDDEFEVSKTEVKREMQRYQEIGERLCNLPAQQWQSIIMSDALADALKESLRIKKHEAKRRHYQYIGKLMRSEDVAAIQEAMDLLDPSSEAYGRRLGQCEQWRQRLLDDDAAISAFIQEHSAVDRQQLRNLVRNARRDLEKEPNKPSASSKKLFQFIRGQFS